MKKIKRQPKITRNFQTKNLTKEQFFKLKSTKVLTAGTGRIAAKTLVNLTNSGVGTIGIIENEKAELILSEIEKYNYNALIKIHNEPLNSTNADAIIQEYDLIVDCLPNYDLKFRLNELAVKYNKPLIYSNVTENYVQIAMIIPHTTACLNCMYSPEDLANHIYSPQTAILSNAASAILADIATDFILEKGHYSPDKMISYFHPTQKFNQITLTRKENCPVCAKIKASL